MDKVFIDADVLLDLYILREPHHDNALRLFSELKRSNTLCYTSAVVVANIYYLLARLQNRQYAVEKLRRLRKLVSIAPVAESTVDAALSLPYKDFEDSIQFHCAIQNGIGTLITRNTKDYPKTQLRVVDPTQYLGTTFAGRSG
jgi:predicted nucleic acid-binding protein